MPLISINLSRNDIGDDGVSFLVAKWRNSNCLTDLDLSCNSITDNGAVTVGQHLTDLVNLRYVYSASDGRDNITLNVCLSHLMQTWLIFLHKMAKYNQLGSIFFD